MQRRVIVDGALRTALVSAVLLIFGAPVARAGEGEVAADLVAITDETVFVDVHARAQHGFLAIARDGQVKRFWRELPKGSADCANCCDRAMAELAQLLEAQSIGGVRLDARQCGRHDGAWTALLQPMVDGKPAPTGRFVTSLTLERLQANRRALAFGPFVGARWSARFTGKLLNLDRDRQPFMSMPTGLSPQVATGWVAVSPNAGMVIAFDGEYGGFQLWIRASGRWRSIALINALDLS